MSWRSLLRERTSKGLRQAVHTLAHEARMQRRHRTAVRQARALRLTSDLRLNLGCGPNLKAGWVNIDMGEEADLRLDLREDLPFLDDSVSLIYSEHFFEHLDYPTEVAHLLAEALRILVPGGRFSLGVPRVENALRDYVHGEDTWFKIVQADWHPSWCNTRMHNINYLFRQAGEHKYAYDKETLVTILAEAGFVDISERDWTGSIDSETRRGSLYVDAFKPALGGITSP
jgi:predicted SAM-dependent methyltransferase